MNFFLYYSQKQNKHFVVGLDTVVRSEGNTPKEALINAEKECNITSEEVTVL